MKPGRNDPCPCNSGEKYKKCCGKNNAETETAPLVQQKTVKTDAVEQTQESLPQVEMQQLITLYQAGSFVEIENRAQKLLQLYPKSGFTWKALGIALKRQGKDALHVLTRVVELLPNDAEAHCNLANTFKSLGQLAEADASFRRALALNPDFAEAYNGLGNVLQEIRQFEEAAASFRQALRCKPDFAIAYCNLGNALQYLGQYEQAIATCNQALQLNPDFAEAYLTLGKAWRNLGNLEVACENYRQALKIRPAYAEAYNNLGNVLREIWKNDEAITCYRQALQINPNYADAYNNLSKAVKKENYAEGQMYCQKALQIDPNLTNAMVNMAEFMEENGQFAAAESMLLQAIAREPELAEAWAAIPRLRKMTDGDDEWLSSAQKIVDSHVPPRQEAALRYALGKYFDDIKHYEQAFPQYQRANELGKSYGKKYDRQRATLIGDTLRHTYDSAWVRRERADANRSTLPVFIIGMPRSGTSLAEQILASHPAVFGAGELSFWGNSVAALDVVLHDDAARENMLRQQANDYLQLLQGFVPDALKVVDKMPANFQCLGLIHAALPNARIIHMQRNPIDTCLSIYFQHFDVNHPYAYDLADIAHYYTEYIRIMEHWKSVLPANAILDVPYEALVADQEGWSHKMIDFVGLPWDERCANFHLHDRAVKTCSNWQVRQKISKTSVERWRHYEKFVGPLLDLLKLTDKSAVEIAEDGNKTILA